MFLCVMTHKGFVSMDDVLCVMTCQGFVSMDDVLCVMTCQGFVSMDDVLCVMTCKGFVSMDDVLCVMTCHTVVMLTRDVVSPRCILPRSTCPAGHSQVHQQDGKLTNSHAILDSQFWL